MISARCGPARRALSLVVEAVNLLKTRSRLIDREVVWSGAWLPPCASPGVGGWGSQRQTQGAIGHYWE